MDIYKFLNSKDIANYWKEIGFIPNALESAYIIWQSYQTPLEEKHAAWQEIINTMPNCKIPKRRYCKDFETLHGLLKEYIQMDKKLLERFFQKEDGWVYRYKSLYKGEDDFCNDYRDLYADFDSCYAEAFDDEDVVFAVFKKCKIGEKHCEIETSITKDKNVYSVDGYAFLKGGAYEDYSAFEEMWFRFPTPFRKGDLLWGRCHPYGIGVKKTPMVLSNLCTWGATDYKEKGIARKVRDGWDNYEAADRRLKNLTEFGDFTDMTIHGFFSADDEVYYECAHNYLDFEYCREPLEGRARILTAISNYLKGEIDVDHLLTAYMIINNEEQANEFRKFINIRDEDFFLCGLTEKNKN